MPSATPLTVIFPSDLAYLPVVRSFVESAARLGGLDQRGVDAIVLAVNEAASNAVRHAHRSKPEATVQVQCVLLEDGIEVFLLDQGDPFDLAGAPHLDPAEIRCGGRGVFLMRALVDELGCCQRADGGNVIRMVKRCTIAVSDSQVI